MYNFDSFEFSINLCNDLLPEINRSDVCLFLARESYGIGSVAITRNFSKDDSSSLVPENKAKISHKNLKRPAQISHNEPRAKPKVVPKQLITQSVINDSASGFQQNPDDFIATSQSLDTGKKSFSCKFCGFEAPVKARVVRHITLRHMTGGNVINCTICEYSSKLKENMKRHYIKTHKLPEAMARGALG